MKRFKSDIPANAVEQITREFRRDGLAIFHRLTDCVLNGEVVGQRAYGEEDQLVAETPLRNGYEWWLRDKSHILWHELHWHEGQYHGIERQWNPANKLRRGFPQYWIKGERVPKRKYLRAAKKDLSLPPFRMKDNSPRRRFPFEIEQLFS